MLSYRLFLLKNMILEMAPANYFAHKEKLLQASSFIGKFKKEQISDLSFSISEVSV